MFFLLWAILSPQKQFPQLFPHQLTLNLNHRDWILIHQSKTTLHSLDEIEYSLAIDHFHYDVTRAKVSGSCSKDHAQCRAIAGKCQKISRSAMSAKASYQVFHKVMCSIAIKIQRNSAWSFYAFFSFDKRGIAKSVINEHCNGKRFFPNSGYRVCSGKTWQCANIISLMRKRIEGVEGVSERGDIEQLEQFLNNRTKWRLKQ